MVADDQKRENLAKMEKSMLENLQDLERELSKLKAEREMALAEVEELNATKKCVYIQP
jgi:Rho-type GTPase-activating protein 1/2